MAGEDDGSVVGFIRGINERKRARAIEDAQRNYLSDPSAAIAAVNQVQGGGPEAAYALQQRYQQDQARQLATQTAQQQRYFGAVRNMAGMLGQARDSGGDVGAAFDTIAPVLKSGLGMADEDISKWRGSILQNPTIIDALARDADAKLMNISAGAAVYDPNTKKEVYANPGLAKPIQIKRGDGGTDVMVWDPEQRAFVTTQGATPSSGAPAAGAMPNSAYSGPKTIDQGARGIRNNNPLNLKGRAGAFAGQSGNDGAFATFSTPEAGIAAAQAQLQRYFQKGKNTVNTVLDGTGPDNPGWLGWPGNKGDDNSAAARANYKAYVAGRLGIDPNAPIPQTRIRDLMTAMSEFENGGQQRQSGGGAAQPAYSTPGKPTKPNYHIATEAEKRAAGVDPSLPFQVSPDGKMEPVGPTGKGSPFQGNSAKAKLSSQMLNTVQSQRKLVLDSIDQAIKGANGWTVGNLSSSALRRIPGTDAYDYAQTLDTIKANIGFDRLQQMREQSPTGGALGQVAVRELESLQASLGSIDPNQSQSKIVANLRRIKQHYEGLLNALSTDSKDITDGTIIKNPKTGARMIMRNGNWEKL